ncbi:MAG: T9SS type A sorting domain-containing protein [candidate division WOR-3 bacterium]
MQKLMLLSLIIVFTFAGPLKPGDVLEIPHQAINATDEVVPQPVNPIVQQLFEASKNCDWVRYDQLLKEWKNQLPPSETNGPNEVEINIEQNPILRWGEDKIIYAGDVAYNPWALENEAISVDHYRGDTLRAAVVIADSALLVFQSNDNGMTWQGLMGWSASWMFYEPEIINDPQGRWYHVFYRASTNNGDVRVLTDSLAGGWYGFWIENTSDTVENYTVCSDRADHPDNYWLYCAFHNKRGGQGYDRIRFTRSFNFGLNWETPTAILINGAGYPDLAYGDNGYLYITRIFNAVNDTNYIRVTPSSDRGNTWGSHVTIQSDTTTKLGPQIAAAHDGSGDVWLVWARNYPYTTPSNYDLLWSWSQDFGSTWSNWRYLDGLNREHTILPSISVYDASGYHSPYVSYNAVDTVGTNPKVYTTYWQTDSTWADRSTYNDSVPQISIRPAQTWEFEGIPALAYVGEGGHNVYYDAWSMGGVEEEKATKPKQVLLSHNQPNPFTNRTRVQYYVPQDGRVSLKVYNTLGKEVVKLVDEYKKAGAYSFTLNREELGRDILPAGVYFLKLEVNNAKVTRKIVIQ